MKLIITNQIVHPTLFLAEAAYQGAANLYQGEFAAHNSRRI